MGHLRKKTWANVEVPRIHQSRWNMEEKKTSKNGGLTNFTMKNWGLTYEKWRFNQFYHEKWIYNWLVGSNFTILKDMSQWEGWHPIYDGM